MAPTERRPWSDLPVEILSMIGSRLDTRTDVLRFRSICSSFRSSIPAPRREAASRLFPLRIQPGLSLRASTVYALETPDEGSSGGRARWLLKLEESEPGHMRILSLFSQRRIAYLLDKFPKVLDSSQFRMVEICRQYALDYSGGGTGAGFRDVQKVVMHPDGVGSDLDQCSVYFIDEGGRVGYWRYGDENCSHLDNPQGCYFRDIAVYQGKVLVVDQSGSVSQIDSSFRLQSFSLPICSINGHRRHFMNNLKHLVVSSADLYLVDGDNCYSGKMSSFDVYRLDQQRGRWEEVRSLGNSAFFICNLSSFVVPARELGGRCAGNCIYHAENYRSNFHVFSLADRRLNWLPYSDFLIGLFR